MRLYFVIMLLSVVAGMAQARSEWYDVPLEIDAGVTVIDQVPESATEAVIHVRMQAPEWALRWGINDKGDYYEARVSMPLQRDAIYTEAPSVALSVMKNGSLEPLWQKSLSHRIERGDFCSMRIVLDGGDATISVGRDDTGLTSPVPFAAGAVAVVSDTPLRCQRLQVKSFGAEPIFSTDFTDVNAMLEHAFASDDAYEGVWEYLDRDVDADRATVGGRYHVATIKTQKGGYDIVYVDGATVNSRMWRPLMIKGRLQPTLFADDFDLEWYDSGFNAVSGDLNASISADRALLTFRFPLLGAQVRFRRVLPR